MCSALFGSLAFGIVFKRCKSNGLMSDIRFGSINSHSRLRLTTLAGMWRRIDELVYLVLQWDPSQISEPASGRGARGPCTTSFALYDGIGYPELVAGICLGKEWWGTFTLPPWWPGQCALVGSGMWRKPFPLSQGLETQTTTLPEKTFIS
ncbi:unnamed protein product [Prunus brigantina]